MLSCVVRIFMNQTLHLLKFISGAGWGGCIVALVPHTKVNDYIEFLQSRYYTGLEKAKELDMKSYLFPTKPGPGAQVFAAK